MTNVYSRNLASLTVVLVSTSVAWADDKISDWKKTEAAHYLDERAKAWFAFPSGNRGEGATRTSCINCHVMVNYSLARPALRKGAPADVPTEYEQKLLSHVKTRVAGWKELDTPKFALMYDSSEQKKKESWGTEAVLNALLLSFEDRNHGRTTPSDLTKQAFSNLWKVQVQGDLRGMNVASGGTVLLMGKIQIGQGDLRGFSWDWLNFNLEPWESKGARYHGAAWAALAVGTAPGYYPAALNQESTDKVNLLRGYLRGGFAAQNLFNRVWALWASTKLDGILTPEERKATISQLWEKQHEDGGWNLASLGPPYVRVDKTPQETASDGYATGVVLHVLQEAGVGKDDVRLAKGLTWLRANQAPTGEWRAMSVNKHRDPATHIGKFMSDAATAYAVLALSH